jgi:hypothetical protein
MGIDIVIIITISSWYTEAYEYTHFQKPSVTQEHNMQVMENSVIHVDIIGKNRHQQRLGC